MLAAHRKTVPEGQWITAIGAANHEPVGEHRLPTLKELDDAVPDRPVLLYQGFNGAAATNTLGKRFFDAADAAPPLHPDYIKRCTSPTPAPSARPPAERWPVHEHAVPAAAAADVRRQEAERAPHDGVFHEPRPDRLARQVDHLRARPAAPASGLGERRSRTGPATPGMRSTTKAGCRCGCRWTSRPSPSCDDNAMLKEYLRNALPYFGDDMLRTGGIGEWPAPAAAVEQTRAAQRLVAQAGWRCDNDAVEPGGR